MKKSMLRSVEGPDMVFLFDYIGKVPAEATFDMSINTIVQPLMDKHTKL